MSDLTENEILACHVQALKDAKGACELLGKNAMQGYLAPRGHNYGNLQRALKALEGSARQMTHFREDTRWLKLGILYAKVMRLAQAKFVGQQWDEFNKMMPIFDKGLRNMDALKNNRTGRMGMILPSQPTDWLVLPDHRVPTPFRGPVH